MINKKTKKTIGIIALIIIGLVIANQAGIFKPLVIGEIGFTPIYCNDYQFTCCNERATIQNLQIGLRLGEYRQCPLDATRCTVSHVSGQGNTYYVGSTNCRMYDPLWSSPYWRCDDERLIELGRNFELSRGQYISSAERAICIGRCAILRTIAYYQYEEVLNFCGRAGCQVGVAVLGADGCHFNPPQGRIYTEEGVRRDVGSYTVPLHSCVLSWNIRDRHICGNLEEQCEDDNDCIGHTYGPYGNQECIGRTLQTYGCRELPLPRGVEIVGGEYVGEDALPGEAVDYGRRVRARCEIVRAEQVQCCGDADCGQDYVCNVENFRCEPAEEVECRRDYDCGVSTQCNWQTRQLERPICSNGRCDFERTAVDCCIDSNCAVGYYCNADRQCERSVVAKTVCPYDCCIDEELYLDRPCPENRPFCTDNVCTSREPPPPEEEECKSCAEWFWGNIIPIKKCETPKILLGLAPKYSVTLCITYVLQMFVIAIGFLLVVLILTLILKFVIKTAKTF